MHMHARWISILVHVGEGVTAKIRLRKEGKKGQVHVCYVS